VGRVTKNQAEAKATRTDEIIDLLDRGLAKLPENCNIVTFVKYDGNPPIAEESQKVSKKSHLADIFDGYIAAHDAALEPRTLYTVSPHISSVGFLYTHQRIFMRLIWFFTNFAVFAQKSPYPIIMGFDQSHFSYCYAGDARLNSSLVVNRLNTSRNNA
jgi:hypothetical protein